MNYLEILRVKMNIQDRFNQTKIIIDKSKILESEIIIASQIILKSLKKGGKVIVMGNGGSAADAQHFVAEFVGRYKSEREPLAAIALTTDTSILTAVGNDYSFDEIFSRQCKAILKPEDIILAISTSGNSKNIVQGIKYSKNKSAIIIGLTGKTGGKMKNYCDVILKVPSTDTPKIQEIHRIILHIICEIIEESIKKK